MGRSIDDQVDEGTLGVDNQTFNVWISQASVVSNQKDTLYDNDSLVQSNINLNTTGALTDNITLASEDNDTARILLSYGNGDDNTSSEAGDNGSFTIKLQTRPLDNVTIFFNDNDTSGRSLGLRFIPDNLTFTGQTDNWSTSRTVVFGSRMIRSMKEPRVLTTRPLPRWSPTRSVTIRFTTRIMARASVIT